MKALNFRHLIAGLDWDGTSADETFQGGAGDDSIDGKGGSDTLYGGAGNDYMSPGSKRSYLYGEGGEDRLLGSGWRPAYDGHYLDGGEGGDDYEKIGLQDTIQDTGTTGIDTLKAERSYVLSATSGIETVLAYIHLDPSFDPLVDIDASAMSTSVDIVGNTARNVLKGSHSSDYLEGGKGDDTYFVNMHADIVVEKADQGSDTVSVTGSYELKSYQSIETMVCTTTDQATALRGNNLANHITGNDAANTIIGGGGDDTLLGGKGSDVIEGDGAVSIEGGDGDDNLHGNGSDMDGGQGQDILHGGAAVDTMSGGEGDDTLFGGAGDEMRGQGGADTYHIDSKDVSIVELGYHTDTDVVVTKASGYALAAGLEDLIADSDAGLLLIGNNESRNRIVGHNGDDTIDAGASKSGSYDTLEGGRGDDLYFVHDEHHQVQEHDGFGADKILVKKAIDYKLGADAEVERLEADGGSSSTVQVGKLTGNKYANWIIAHAGNNTLDGGGAAGDAVDMLHGGIGNDTYVVHRAGDVVEETVDASGGSEDVIEVHATSFTLSNTMGIEVLDGYSADTTHLTGNDYKNTILGAHWANGVLQGNGGDDLIVGGGGQGREDTAVFRGDRADYTITLQLNGSYLVKDKQGDRDGTDTLVSIERFRFLDKTQSEAEVTPDVVIKPEEPQTPTTPGPGTGGGTGTGTGTNPPVVIKNLVLTGTKAKDQLIGGKGSDTLFGKLGNDMLIGADGADLFVFDTKPNAKKNVDWITDFVAGQDRIGLDNATFKAFGKKGTPAAPAGLKKGAFKLGNEAKDQDDRIIYNKTKGALYYDADGKGGVDQIQIAKLSKGLALSHKDFFVV